MKETPFPKVVSASSTWGWPGWSDASAPRIAAGAWPSTGWTSQPNAAHRPARRASRIQPVVRREHGRLPHAALVALGVAEQRVHTPFGALPARRQRRTGRDR